MEFAYKVNLKGFRTAVKFMKGQVCGQAYQMKLNMDRADSDPVQSPENAFAD